MTTQNNPAQGITWDLTHLYASMTDPRISEDLAKAKAAALAFEKEYKPLFAAAQAGAFPIQELLADYKKIITLTSRPASYAQLLFSGKTDAPEIGAFMQRTEEECTDIHAHLIFFDVEWNQLPEETARAITQRATEQDRHLLNNMRIYAPHTLREGEEKIMSFKSHTSGSAFSRLFDETLNNIRFSITENGQPVSKSESEIIALLHSPQRETRRKAGESLAEGLSRNAHLLTYIFNMILADQRVTGKIRSYSHPLQPRNLANEVDLKTVLNLMEQVKKAYPIAQRYYRLKKKLLKLDTLYDYDRYAPLDADEKPVSFDACKEIVLKGYYQFSETAGKIAERFFQERWIDAELRPGKQGGGFCAHTTPEVHPYILVNYTGNIRDVMTVAHELGHGIHQYLAAQRAGVLEAQASLVVAETASVFGEMLIFEEILKREKDPRGRLNLLCGKIDDQFATVFRQIVLTDFELNTHQHGLAEGEIGEEQINIYWMQANAELYGNTVTLTPSYRHGWKYIPHFIHTPFYCYAYAFAQLFVLCLYQKYKEEKEEFLPKYFAMLSLGGSKRPEEIAALASLNIQDEKFWQGGLTLLDALVKEAETL